MKQFNTFIELLFFVSLVGGVALTAYGLFTQVGWGEALKWLDSYGSINLFILAIGVICVSLLVAIATLKGHLVYMAGIVLFIIILFAGAIWPILVVTWFSISAYITGKVILQAIKLPEQAKDFLAAFLVGAGLWGFFIGLIAHIPVNYPGVYGLLLALPLFLKRKEIASGISALKSSIVPGRISSDWLTALIVLLVIGYTIIAFLPELGHDALAMHLFVPNLLESKHFWGFNPDLYAWAMAPMLGDWLYSIVYMLAGESAARLLNLEYTLVLAWIGWKMVVWAGGSRQGAKWTVLLLLSTPLTYTVTTSLFIDSIWAAYILYGALIFFQFVSKENSHKDMLKVGGIVFGVAAAAKAVTLPYLPVFAAMLLFRWRGWLSRDILVSLAVGILFFLLVGGTPYFTAWCVTGNPVFPYFNGFFQSDFYPAVNFNNKLYNSGFHWSLPYYILFDSGKFLEARNGASGFQWLLLLFPCFFFLVGNKKYRALGLISIGVLLVAITFHQQSYLRYVLPSFVILAATIGVCLSAELGAGRGYRMFKGVAVITVLLNLLFITSGSWPYRILPPNTLKILLSDSAREDFIERKRPIRRAVEYVNQININKTPVAFFSETTGAGLSSDALYYGWYNSSFKAAVDNAGNAALLSRVLLNYNAKFVLLNPNRVSAKKRSAIRGITDYIMKFGSIEIRSLKKSFLFSKELIRNWDFNEIEGWNLSPGAKYDSQSKTMRVSASAKALQVVPVRGQTYYLNTVVARCYDDLALGRLQINWKDANGAFIKPSFETFDCNATWETHFMELFSPLNASSAVVFASGHNKEFLLFKENSLKTKSSN